MIEGMRPYERKAVVLGEGGSVPEQAVCSCNSSYVQAVSAEYEVQHVLLVRLTITQHNTQHGQSENHCRKNTNKGKKYG